MANKQRLALLRYLLCHPESDVSEIAREMGLSVSSASQHLRTLNARGLLLVRRAGRHVYYRAGSDESVPDTVAILAAVALALQARGRPVESAFRTVTACTHPRRLDILRSLNRRRLTLVEIRRATGVSLSALQRHLRKLKARGFVTGMDGIYRCCKPRDPLARALQFLAMR